jgi:hypothetical protein
MAFLDICYNDEGKRSKQEIQKLLPVLWI